MLNSTVEQRNEIRLVVGQIDPMICKDFIKNSIMCNLRMWTWTFENCDVFFSIKSSFQFAISLDRLNRYEQNIFEKFRDIRFIYKWV